MCASTLPLHTNYHILLENTHCTNRCERVSLWKIKDPLQLQSPNVRAFLQKSPRSSVWGVINIESVCKNGLFLVGSLPPKSCTFFEHERSIRMTVGYGLIHILKA